MITQNATKERGLAPLFASALAGFWHPVARADALACGAVLAAKLLGQDVALWRSADGQCHAALDRCPHRGAKLSLGMVRELSGQSVLQCAYHGWCFDAQAQCVHVPAQPDWEPPPSHKANPLACVEQRGMIWVSLDASAEAQRLPLRGWAAGTEPTLCGPFDVAASAPRVVENFLDMTHFAMVHPGTLGGPGHEAMPPYDVVEHAEGLSVADCSVWQPDGFGVRAGAVALVHYRYEVVAPLVAWFAKKASNTDLNPLAMQVALLCCPLDETHTRVWFDMALAPGSDRVAAVDFQTTIFEQDRAILESQTPKCIDLSGGHELNGPLDRVSSAYRRYLAKVLAQAHAAAL